MEYEGQLVHIRLLIADDALALHSLIDRNRAHLSRFVLTGTEYPDYESVLQSITHPRPHEHRFGIWSKTQELVGFVKIKLVEPHTAEIEGWLGAEFTKQGFMTEAMGIMLEAAYRDFGCHEALARVDKANSPSLAVVAKYGFRTEADPAHPNMYLLRRGLPIASHPTSRRPGDT